MIKVLIKNYGMILVLIGLCILFSILTINEQNPENDSAANQIINKIQNSYALNDIILSVGASNKASGPFASLLKEKPLVELENQIDQIRELARDSEVDVSQQL